MAAKKGHTKSGGRAAGTPNKITKSIRENIFDIISESISTVKDDLKSLEPKERLQIISGLLPYVVSKRQEGSNRFYTFDFPNKDPEKDFD